MTRIAAALTVAAALLLSACGDDEPDAASSAAAPAAEPAAFPVTIEHKYGSTTIEKAPKRVVVAGLREQHALLALGIVPVATTEWYGDHPGAIFPWAEEALGDAPRPEVLGFTDGIQFEKIAGLRPDLIIAVYSGLTQKDYDTLSKLAPTVAQPPGQVDWGSSWQDEILMVGKAVGKPKEAVRLRDEAQAKLDAAAEAHPGLHVPIRARGHRRRGLRRQPLQREARPARRRRARVVRRSRPGDEDPQEPPLQPPERQPRGS